MNKQGLKLFEEFKENPFLTKKIGTDVDIDFVLKLSKSGKNIIKYMVYKKAYLGDKLLFDVEEFNIFAGYNSQTAYLTGIVQLCSIDILPALKDEDS